MYGGNMQFKTYTIPLYDNKEEVEELNLFLRENKIIDVQKNLIQDENKYYWNFLVEYAKEVKNQQGVSDSKKSLDRLPIKKLEVEANSKGGIIRIPYEYEEFLNTNLKVILIKSEREDGQEATKEEKIKEFRELEEIVRSRKEHYGSSSEEVQDTQQ